MEKIYYCKKRNILFRNAAIIFGLLVIIGMVIGNLDSIFETPAAAVEFLRGLGMLGPFVIIAILIMEVIVAPIPGFLIAISTGLAFGSFWGAIYTYTGNIIGSIIAFFLARRFGRPLIEHLAKKKALDKYDAFFRERGKSVLWIVYLVPIFPADVVTFVAGLTDLKFKEFIFIISYAFIPYVVVLNLFGGSLASAGIDSILTLLGIIIFLVLLSGWFGYHLLTKGLPEPKKG